MSGDGVDKRPEAVDAALSDMKLEESSDATLESIRVNGNAEHSPTPTATKDSRSPSLEQSNSLTSAAQTPRSEGNGHEEILGDGLALKLEPGKQPKLSRKASQKVVSRPPPLFDHLPDSTTEAVSTFQVIRDCIYGSKYMGSSEHDALGCDCSEEWSEYRTIHGLLTGDADSSQETAGIMHVEKTRIVSIVLQKWNASTMSATVVQGAKTNASSVSNSPKCL